MRNIFYEDNFLIYDNMFVSQKEIKELNKSLEYINKFIAENQNKTYFIDINKLD